MVDFQHNKTVDEYLNEVDYTALHNPATYVPSQFALEFANFINLTNDGRSEGNKTPIMHLAMLDKLTSNNPRIVNLCARGTGKSTLMFDFLGLYGAVFTNLPGIGEFNGMLYVSDSMENGARTARESIETRYGNSDFLKVWLPKAKFTESFIQFENKSGKKFGIKLYGATSGIRGTRIFNKRPVLAVLDDLVSDAASTSPTTMAAINKVVYSGVTYALDPTKYKIVLSGTPYNKNDIVYEAIESGAWSVNVWPICERFPVTREEFVGAWPDRFNYDYVQSQYDFSVAQGKERDFRQELMLRISSDDSRLIQSSDIKWCSRAKVLERKHKHNFYITTDFATSSKETADYSVISVWAYDTKKNWIWVDGVCQRMTMDKTIKQLFRLAKEYSPQQIGIEVSGQQGGFIPWLQSEMSARNTYYALVPVKPVRDKLSRLNMMVPSFKSGKMYFAEEMRKSTALGIGMTQIELATVDGLKGKDDFLDTISMLEHMNPWAHSEDVPDAAPVIRDRLSWGDGDMLVDPVIDVEPGELSSYIV